MEYIHKIYPYFDYKLFKGNMQPLIVATINAFMRKDREKLKQLLTPECFVATIGTITKAPTHMLAEELKIPGDIPFIINRHNIYKLKYKFCAPVLTKDGYHEFRIRIRIRYKRQYTNLESGEDMKLKTRKTNRKFVISIRQKKRKI